MPRSFHIPFRCLASHSFRRRIIAYCRVETQQRGYVVRIFSGARASCPRRDDVSWSEGILLLETRCGRDARAPRFVDDPRCEQVPDDVSWASCPRRRGTGGTPALPGLWSSRDRGNDGDAGDARTPRVVDEPRCEQLPAGVQRGLRPSWRLRAHVACRRHPSGAGDVYYCV